MTHIRLVNAEFVEGIRAKTQELATVSGRDTGSVFAYGDPGFVVGVMAMANIVSWFAQESQAADVLRLTEEIADLGDRTRTGGMFFPVSEIQGIEVPIPGCWYVEVTKRLRTESGTVEKVVRLTHSGDSFITVQLKDSREVTVFWGKVESIEFHADE